ncbi:MAG: MaoC family dehydratase [Planctomycetes bacterium]|nr:MaoC family dehydratase [Planctomycetota bacterium]
MTEPPNRSSIGSASEIDTIRGFYGDREHTSDWFEVTQDLVNQFGIATCDSDWIHTDPARARNESPYGNTVAHGFWTVSMLSFLSRNATGGDYPPGAQLGINYGLDRARFPGPVRVGARIRLRFKLVDVACRNEGQYLVKTENVIEVEGQGKPALVADWLFLLIYRTGPST